MLLLRERRYARAELKRLGVEQPWEVRLGHISFVALVVTGSATAFFVAQALGPGATNVNGTSAATAVLGVGAFLVGYHQWRTAKHETSMERYYDRLKITNDARRALAEADHTVKPMDMYTYLELDNLEYVLQKYKLGYMSPEQAWRGVKTFRSRVTGVRGFRECVQAFGDLVESAGYHPETHALVRRLAP